MIEVSIKLNELKIKGENSLLPFDEEISIAAFANVSGDDIEKPVEFFRYLAQAFTGDIDFGFIDENISNHDLEAIKSGITKSDLILFLMIFGDDAVLSEKMLNVMHELTGDRKSVLITNKALKIMGDDAPNLYIQMPDLSEISLVSTIVKLSGKNIDNKPTE